MAIFELDAQAVEELYVKMRKYPGTAARAIDSVFHGGGYKLIDESIHKFMPVSGRSFSGKASPAKTSKSLKDRDKSSRLSVTVTTKPTWHYLYFPDDGTTTIHHAGNQQFFMRGTEAISDKVVDLCLEEIVEKIEL